MKDIAKLCADSLRAYVGEERGIKLGSAHAHELVAAYFGYQSRAALLSDKKHPLNKLIESPVVVPPPIGILERRMKVLLGEAPGLPGADAISRHLFDVLKSERCIVGSVYSGLEALAIEIAKGHQDRVWRELGIGADSVKTNIDVKIELEAELLSMIAFMSYLPSATSGEWLRERKVAIQLSRVAANIGFGQPKSYETRYSGYASKMSVPDVDVWPVQTV